MAVVQQIEKPAWIQTCSDYNKHFMKQLDSIVKDYNEAHLVFERFDRYDVSDSLIEARPTRKYRKHDKVPVAYHISDSSNIAKLSALQFLAHKQTKHELTQYLAAKSVIH